MRWYQRLAYAKFLAYKVRSSGWQPDVIVAIGNGGTQLGQWIARELEAPLEILSVRRPISIASDRIKLPKVLVEVVKAFQKPRLVEGFSTDVRGKKVLLVDNGMGTGKTMEVARQYLLEKGVHVNQMKTAVMYSLKGKRIPQPDYDLSQRWTRALPARKPKSARRARRPM